MGIFLIGRRVGVRSWGVLGIFFESSSGISSSGLVFESRIMFIGWGADIFGQGGTQG